MSREAHALGQLRHPGIAQIYEAEVAPIIRERRGLDDSRVDEIPAEGDILAFYAARGDLTKYRNVSREALERQCIGMGTHFRGRDSNSPGSDYETRDAADVWVVAKG